MTGFSLRSWLKATLGTLWAPTSLPPKHRTARLGFRPGFETLEGRTLLSGSPLLVTNLNDSGDGSLRAAITAADATSGAVIDFASGLHGTIRLTSGELDITSNMTINGRGANQLTISGNHASRIFNLSNNATATITDLTIADGMSVNTGEDSGTLLDATQLGGGGILNQAGATLNLTRCVLFNNTTVASSPDVDSIGGGLLNEGTALITFSVIRNNQALGGGGFSFFGGSVGGGIDNFGGGILTVANSTFSNNAALSAEGAYGIGGALENNSGLDDSSPSTATICNCTFVGNIAGGSGGVTANGGAITDDGTGAMMTITASTILNNKAFGGDYADGETTAGQALGGGVLVSLGGTLNLSDSLLAGNMALGGNHCTLTTDIPATGGGFGGGLLVGFAQATVTNCILFGNVAQGGDTESGPGGNGIGGGIENAYNSTLTVSNSLIVGNEAIAGRGGPGTSPVLAGVGMGGGIDDSAYSSATISDSIIAGNLALGGTGGPGNDGGAGLGGGISVGFDSFFPFTDSSSLTLTNSLVEHNWAVGGQGGDGGNGGSGLGGGMIIFADSSATVSDSIIAHNAALGGRKGVGGSEGTGVGGGVYNLGTFAAAPFVLIKKNHATTSHNDIYP